MRLQFHLSKLALNDLDSIWAYTCEKWSIKQANEYYNEILDVINLICDNPQIGKSIQEVKQNHRSRIVRSHMIIYKIENNHIYIDRILHQNMDVENKLKE